MSNVYIGRVLQNEIPCSCGGTMTPRKSSRIFKVYYIKYICKSCDKAMYFDRETGEEE